jgi:hypothetical protein
MQKTSIGANWGWSGSRRSLLALPCLLGLCLCLTIAPPAVAGSYHDFLCRIPYGPSAGRPAPTEDVTYATSGQYVYANTGCGGGGEGSLHAQMLGNVQHSAGDGAKDTFNVPAGLEVAGFIVWRYEADGPEGADAAPVSDLYYYDPGAVAVQTGCARSLGCYSRGVRGNPLDPENAVEVGNLNKEPSLSGVTAIQWIAECGGSGACPESGTEYSSQYEVYAADIDLVDNTPPSVSGVSGPLVAGGTLSGNASVSFDASDGQSGVYGGSLVVDGKTVVSQILNTNGGACESLNVTDDGQRSFEHAKPCLSSLNSSLTLNTSTLAAGAHSLELIVEDAAGNQAIAYNGTITIAGSSPGAAAAGAGPGAPIGPGSPLAQRGAPNGANASDQAKLTARWTSTSKAMRTSGYGRADRVSGRLTTSTGQPISGALLDVSATAADQGAKAASLASVRTGPTGAWTLTLPKGISSSALRFAYRSHVDDTIPVATATLTLRVHAGVGLRITPRTTSVGHTISFSGTLHGAPIPPGGKQLVLEASSGREWIEFRTITTDAKGRFHSSYRFKFPGPIVYRFRVLSPHEAAFPFLAGSSNVVDVHER